MANSSYIRLDSNQFKTHVLYIKRKSYLTIFQSEKVSLPLASLIGLPPFLLLNNFDGRIQSFVVVIFVIATGTAYKPRGKWGPGKE